jgi:hypothetical protein
MYVGGSLIGVTQHMMKAALMILDPLDHECIHTNLVRSTNPRGTRERRNVSLSTTAAPLIQALTTALKMLTAVTTSRNVLMYTKQKHYNYKQFTLILSYMTQTNVLYI